MSSYPEVPSYNDATARDAVQAFVESHPVNTEFSLRDLVRGTGMSYIMVRRGIHYYRNDHTPLIQQNGVYWLSDNAEEVQQYRDRMLRYVRTRTKTAVSVLERFEPSGPVSGLTKEEKVKRAALRNTIRDTNRVVENIDDLLST